MFLLWGFEGDRFTVYKKYNKTYVPLVENWETWEKVINNNNVLIHAFIQSDVLGGF